MIKKIFFTLLLLLSCMLIFIGPAFSENGETGTGETQQVLGIDHYMPKDYAGVFNLFKKVADQGNSNAQYNLAVGYSKGRGAPINYKKAYVWYSLASAQGHEKAKHNISVICYNRFKNVICQGKKMIPKHIINYTIYKSMLYLRRSPGY